MAERDAILFKDAIMVHIFRQPLRGHRDCCIGLVAWEVSHIVKLQMQREYNAQLLCHLYSAGQTRRWVGGMKDRG